MKKLWVSSLLATLLAVAPAVAAERPSVPVKGTEGPDTRATLPAPSCPSEAGIEGPAIR